jgi:hypothetical protein
VVADLTGLVSRFPLRERLRRMLILSLHRSERPIDAVAVYVDWHRRLAAAGFVPANALSQMPRRARGAGSRHRRMPARGRLIT